MELTPLLKNHLCWPKKEVTLNTEHIVFKVRPGRHGDRSIRYRVRLAARIVKEAVDVGLLDQELRHLLIINAGAAGLSAAMAAGDLGISAFLRSASGVGAPLGGCTTRHVDPGIYLWPRGNHWTNERVPDFLTPGSPFRPEPLTWKAGSADEIARDWLRQYQDLQDASLKLKASVPDDRLPVTAQKRWADFVRDLHCDPHHRVILVTGIEQENTSIPLSYTGPKFWQNDTLEHWSSGRRPHSALVSGSGDGALQDYLRLVCGNKPARKIYNTIFANRSPRHSWEPPSEAQKASEKLLRKTARTITTIRDLIAKREPLSGVPAALASLPRQVEASIVAYMEEVAFGIASWWDLPASLLEPWSILADDELFPMEDATHRLDKEEIQELRDCLHAEFSRIIRSLVEDQPSWSAICEAIRENQLISPAIRDRSDERRAVLVNHGENFSICYPMNHCLSLLISEYIKRELRLPTIFHHLELTRITPDEGSDHSCRGIAADCFDHAHRATFAVLSPQAGGDHRLEEAEYDPVVIRHGLIGQEMSSRVQESAPALA